MKQDELNAGRGSSRVRTALVLWLVLLGASHALRAIGGSPNPSSTRIAVSTFDALGPLAGEVQIAVEDVRGEAVSVGAERLPVVLLHGSPGRGADFGRLRGELGETRRLIAPDLPGFGASTHVVPDYSARAHARYVGALLDALDVERAHVVGFSLGGAVALELLDVAPSRVASVALVSATGVQELELLGDYHLNHAVHFAQWAALWAVHELIPHFGAFDGGMLSVPYARNFYDTDQRALRSYLQSCEIPMLIVHGRDDVLVPFAAAEEHHRLVPQSTLATLEGNHFLVFRKPGEIAGRLLPFLDSVESGGATTRAAADAERLRRASKPFDPRSLEPLSGFSLVVFLVLVALATLVSEDLTCIAVGALVGQGRVELWPGVLACFVGIYVGDVALFLAGRLLGRRAVGRAPLKYFLSEERVEASSKWFEDRGGRVIFLSRFLPGMRLPTYFAAGVLRTSLLRFSLWFALAAALWTPLLVWLSSRIGGALTDRLELLQENLLIGVVVTVVLGLILVKVVRPAATWRGRRLLVAAWRRRVRWEYWPRWLFYPPIALACVWFGFRRRSFFAFTAVNPAMPHGGFVGESKADILAGLSTESSHVAGTLVLDADLERAALLPCVREFQVNLGEPWPLVVKPDVGQRGDGVSVVRNDEELTEAWAVLKGRVLVQEYIGGVEFGLFYARHPEESQGRVISITRKVLPEVTGDGRRSLETLILADTRAACSAQDFFLRHVARLEWVPAPGEVVRLGELGTHCRGAAFLDGAELLTAELTTAVDALSRTYEGFYFGRYDVRTPSDEALRSGEFKVLELNGVTSECAHVYDPRYSVFDGWRILTAQWRRAYDIGLANARRGARVSTLADLVRAARDYRTLVR